MTTVPTSTACSAPESIPRRELALGTLVLAGLILVFLAEPIARYPSAYYCFADFAQSFSLINVEPGRAPANRMMGDPAVLYLPWVLFNRDQLQDGRLPLWNPYNGGGVPHLGNYQSGVFSPYNVPFYLLDLKTALLVSAFLKLFALALFTYLFLRTSGLGQSAGILGAVGYTFGGYHIAWLSGAIAATAVTLPASLFFIELALRRSPPPREAEPTSRATVLALAGLTVSLTAGLLAGHPESLYFDGLFIAGYVVFRLWRIRSRTSTRSAIILAGRFAACAVVAVLLSAVQLVPFLEYLANSTVIVGRPGLSAGLTSRPAHLWPLLFAPSLLGNATSSYTAIRASSVTWIEAISPYTGGTILLLGILSLWLVRRSGLARFFAGIMGLWLVYVLNPLGIAMVFRAIPGLTHVPIRRSHDIWLFAVSCAAALLLDALLKRRPGAPSAMTISAAGLVLLAVGVLGADRLLLRYRDAVAAAGAEALRVITGDLTFFVCTFAVGLLGAIVVCVGPRRALRSAGAALVIAAAFAQTGLLFRSFNSTIEDRFVYPVTDEIRALQEAVGGDTLLLTGGRRRTLLANTNLVYRLALPDNYDAMWIRRYDQLYRRHFGAGSFQRVPLHFSRLGLQLFGIDYLLGKGPLIDSELVDRRGVDSLPAPLPPVRHGRVVQSFTANDGRLQAVAAFLACRPGPDAGDVDIRLEDVADHDLVARRSVPCQSLSRPRWVNLSFPAIDSSARRRYRLILDGRGQESVQLVPYVWSELAYAAGKLVLEGKASPETLAFDFAYDLDAFERLTTLKGRPLYRYRDGLSRYHTVGRAILAGNDQEALRLLEAPQYDPAEAVILDSPRPSPELGHRTSSPPPGRVDVVSESATRVELTVTRPDPGYLVISRPFFPGWKAAVDGAPGTLLRANYAFMAVEVPAGRSRVTVWYAPASVRWGILVSVVTLALGCGWIGWRGRRSPR